MGAGTQPGGFDQDGAAHTEFKYDTADHGIFIACVDQLDRIGQVHICNRHLECRRRVIGHVVGLAAAAVGGQDQIWRTGGGRVGRVHDDEQGIREGTDIARNIRRPRRDGMRARDQRACRDLGNAVRLGACHGVGGNHGHRTECIDQFHRIACGEA